MRPAGKVPVVVVRSQAAGWRSLLFTRRLYSLVLRSCLTLSQRRNLCDGRSSLHRWENGRADATNIVNQKNTMCIGVNCAIGRMRETGDMPFSDESRTRSWTVRTLFQKNRTGNWTDWSHGTYGTNCKKTQVRKKHVGNELETRKRQKTQIGNEQKHANENGVSL
jgi:hypothetical protein